MCEKQKKSNPSKEVFFVENLGKGIMAIQESPPGRATGRSTEIGQAQRPCWITPKEGIVVRQEIWSNPSTRMRTATLTPAELRRGSLSISAEIVFEAD